MNARTVVVNATLALALAALTFPVDSEAQFRGQGGYSRPTGANSSSAGSHSRPAGSYSRSTGSYSHAAGGHYRAPSYGHRPAHYSGYRYAGYGRGYGYRGGYYGPGWGVYWSAPFLFGSYYYGYPLASWGPRYAYGYPAYSAPYEPSGAMLPPDESSAPTTQVDPSRGGAPTERPLYLNYCESAGAYYPKVTSCPEGWQLRRPTYN